MAKKRLIIGLIAGALAFLCGCSDGQLPPTDSQTTDSATVTESPCNKGRYLGGSVRKGAVHYLL